MRDSRTDRLNSSPKLVQLRERSRERERCGRNSFSPHSSRTLATMFTHRVMSAVQPV